MDGDIDASGDRQFTVTTLDAFTGQMDGSQGGRAHRVHRQTWPMKIAEIGDTIGY